MDGMIGRWLKREGERVEAGEPLVEIITDKAKFDYESPASGILRKIVATEKSTVPVGYVIALFADAVNQGSVLMESKAGDDDEDQDQESAPITAPSDPLEAFAVTPPALVNSPPA